MSKAITQRRLSEVAGELKALRDELAVVDEQLAVLADQADDARLRSLVSETPLADQDLREAQKHADAMSRHQAEVRASIDRLERTQDDLLDRLVAER
jgi:chromosome segregation ATPase